MLRCLNLCRCASSGPMGTCASSSKRKDEPRKKKGKKKGKGKGPKDGAGSDDGTKQIDADPIEMSKPQKTPMGNAGAISNPLTPPTIVAVQKNVDRTLFPPVAEDAPSPQQPNAPVMPPLYGGVTMGTVVPNANTTTMTTNSSRPLVITVSVSEQSRPTASPLPPINGGNHHAPVEEERRKWSVSNTRGFGAQLAPAATGLPVSGQGSSGADTPPNPQQWAKQNVESAGSMHSFASDQHTVPSSRPDGSVIDDDDEDNARKNSAMRSTPLSRPLAGIRMNGVPAASGTATRTQRRMETWVRSAVYGDAAEPVPCDLVRPEMYGILTPEEQAADDELEALIEETRFKLLLNGGLPA